MIARIEGLPLRCYTPWRMLTDLESCTVHVSRSLLDVLRALDRGGVEIALVVDDGHKLCGLLTDGDVRRALLGGADLSSPLISFMSRQFTSVSSSAPRTAVLDLMQARKIAQIPILDAAGRLAGLHLLHDIVGRPDRPNWAVIMAGGRGTRLLPLTENLPKPMVPIAGRPILERLVLQLVGFGIRRVFLSINYLGHVIEEHFGDGVRYGCRIEYLREDRPLGTGGSLSLLPEPPPHPLLVMNGDLVTQADLGALLDHHVQQAARATIGIRRYLHTVPFGCVETADGRVRLLEEKPTLTRQINAGIYALDPGLIERVPPGVAFPLTDLLEDCLARGEALAAFEIEDDWIDVGQRQDYHKASGREA